MSEFSFRLPDLGEGMVEAEIVEWHVAVGDHVAEGEIVADVMTDKANVEVPAPVAGRVLRLGGAPGDMVAVGGELIAFETDADAPAPSDTTSTPAQDAPMPPVQAPSAEQVADPSAPAERDHEPGLSPQDDSAPDVPMQTAPAPAPPIRATRPRPRVPASPAIRKRAAEAGVDLSAIPGTGPGGRILRRDLDAHLAATEPAHAERSPAPPGPAAAFDDVSIIGVRRVIARRLTQSSQEIPHFAYVEEIDVTEVERLRTHLNAQHGVRLTLLPFLAVALIRALPGFPQCNAHYNPESGVLRQYRGVHLGIATQTDKGLKVAVARDAERADVWQLADAIRQVTARARDGSAAPADLSGSTITITSLGRLGGIASTPIINYPETTIIGVNKAVQRPVVIDGRVEVRTMMNLSGSFDHRFIDGFDAASLVQAIKVQLEQPALMWLPAPG